MGMATQTEKSGGAATTGVVLDEGGGRGLEGWTAWSRAQRGGVVAAATVAGVGMLVVVGWVAWANWRRGVKRRAMESGVLLGEKRKKKKGKGKGRARGIEGLERVEMGPAAMRAVYGDLIARERDEGGSGRTGKKGGNGSVGLVREEGR